ncbi:MULTISPECIES: LapD/MoxY N-terminal periplasmic domain-containing protein [unclassified Wenzhouxiangella]|uniref:bifunctional diguanylate cyclase/phosphodiesterase n=1 Tax=unclassified Wenzhouxiangella TaxID=2613841 RepID=UPI000E3274DC|nr:MULTISPECIES: LapD/MoxY N-terminal periplasmic domain-containing protein [unclassified Wenzhouxiangella]RFF26499.1 EAL domain-containing protein [Wenzhouxiangella sp. 15181]RFP69704.1 EAL domain-containing protein [Wenzhouxiangella sp. 15190]
MTLAKQLWVVIGVLITLIFISSFIVSVYTARNYFLEQLTVKNIDNVTSLALSLSQVEKDPVTIELMIAAQFDSGHYKRIELVDPNGETLQVREHPELAPDVPSWFANLMALDVPPGVAQVQDGWLQFGTLYMESQSAYALNALWRVSYQLLIWIIIIALIVGIIGNFLLRRISQPLQSVVKQAEAIGDRRFVTSKEPRTLEFRRVVRAMNSLTERVRSMLETETRRLDEIRRQSQLDPATGVANREQFFRLLDVRLNLQDDSVRDAVLLLRITGLQALNAKLGRAETDEWIAAMLKRIRMVLDSRSDCYSQYTMGRLNGSDFVVLVNDTGFLSDLAEVVWSVVTEMVEQWQLEGEYPIALVGSSCCPGEQRARLMARLDDLLASAEQAPTERLLLADDQRKAPLFHGAEGWRHALERALEDGAVSHACYPVITGNGSIFHEEAMLRMRLADRDMPAGAVIGWARRLNLLPQLDLQLLNSVLRMLVDQPDRQVAVNLSMESLRDVTSHLAIIDCIQRYSGSVTQRLSVELNEQVAVQYAEPLASFIATVKGHGVLMGLQSAGRNIAAVPRLETLGLDYMKVDASLIQQQSADVLSLLRGLCKLGHSLGLAMIAEGVLEQTDQSALTELGFDAFTGPGVHPEAPE